MDNKLLYYRTNRAILGIILEIVHSAKILQFLTFLMAIFVDMTKYNAMCIANIHTVHPSHIRLIWSAVSSPSAYLATYVQSSITKY